jgi:toxin ParE1/3/4
MKLRLTPRATQDLTAIGDYIRSKNPTAAVRVRSAILETLQLLIRFPGAGRAQTVEGVRKIVTRRYPYIVKKSSSLRFNMRRANVSTAISETSS